MVKVKDCDGDADDDKGNELDYCITRMVSDFIELELLLHFSVFSLLPTP